VSDPPDAMGLSQVQPPEPVRAPAAERPARLLGDLTVD
jgi:hypothetical protein